MKTRFSAATSLVLTLFACSLASAQTIQTGEDAEVTFDGLHFVDDTIMDAVWARPDIDLRGTTQVIFVPIGISYREVEPTDASTALRRSTRSRRTELREFQLDEETKAFFEEEIGNAFMAEVGTSEVFEVVDEAGPETLSIGVALLDVVSRVPPQAANQPRVFIESVGEATLVVEIRGSMSNTVYARAVDRRAAQQQGQMIESNRVTNTNEIRRLGRRWGRIVRDGLDSLFTQGFGDED